MSNSNIKNVLLVTYDCARADVVTKLRLPTVEALRRSGVEFTKAISSAPLTPVSHATIFTGLQPYRHGLRHLFREKLDPKCPTLAEVLANKGFDTAAIVSCPGLKSWYGHQRGFAHYDDWLPPLQGGKDPLSVPDVKLRGLALKRADTVADRAIEYLSSAKSGRPWFLFVHFFDAHWPYDPPEESKNASNPYEGELFYSDKHLGRIISNLSELEALEDTLVVVLGDHGEDLGGWYENDKAGPGRAHPEEEGHGCCLFQQTQHVPLLFCHSSLRPSAIETRVGLVDVAPTICGFFNLSLECDGIDLSSYISCGKEPPARTLYAETMYPRELVDNSGTFTSIRNKQAFWLPDGRKILRLVGEPDCYFEYDSESDPLEVAPRQLSAEQGSAFRWPLALG